MKKTESKVNLRNNFLFKFFSLKKKKPKKNNQITWFKIHFQKKKYLLPGKILIKIS